MTVDTLVSILALLQQQGLGSQAVLVKEDDYSTHYEVVDVSVVYVGAGSPTVVVQIEN